MQIEGKIIAVLPLREGDGRQGKWQSQEYVLETQTDYPHKMVFTVFGEDRINRFHIREGQTVYVDFSIDAREYQGRWFNSVRAFDVRLREPLKAPTPQPNVVYAKNAPNELEPDPAKGETMDDTNDLPF